MIAWTELLLLFLMIVVSAGIVVGAVRFAERGFPKEQPKEWLDDEDDD